MFNRFFKKSALFLLFSSILFLSNFHQIFAQTAGDNQTQIVDQSKLYTIMPMFLPSAPSSLNYGDLLTTMTKDQGYEAHCAGAQWVISEKQYGNAAKFFSQLPRENFSTLATQVFGSSDPYIVDFTKARIPVIRGMELKSDTMKNSSIEGMFGANYQTIKDIYMLNSAGVSERLLTSYQQCLAKSQNLISINKICAEIKGEPCSLNKEYSIEVNENPVTFKMLEILEWFSQIRPSLGGDELYQQVCADITGGGSTDAAEFNEAHADLPDVSQEFLDKTKAAVSVISIDMDTLYRLAFLVLVPTQNVSGDADKFHFLQSSPRINAEAQAPIFIAFKIPEFGTNKSKFVNNIDSLELTKMAIQAATQNKADLDEQNTNRDKNYEAAKNAPYIQDPVIKCPEGFPQCARSSDNALLNVLVDMINGAAPNCKDVTLRVVEETTIEEIFNQEDQNWEKAGDLFTPANKDIKENLYKSNTNEETIKKLGIDSSNIFNWQLTVDEKKESYGTPVVVNAYLVLPVGETIKDVNKSLSVFWNEEEFFNLVKTNVIEDMKNADGTNKMGSIPKYYTIKGADVGIASSDVKSYIDTCEETLVLGEDGLYRTEYTCTSYNYGFGLDEEKDAPLYPDFGLGFMLRKIQQTLRATFDQTYDYIASCQRVEDMFLGRCSGDPSGKTQSVCTGESFKNIKNMPSYEGIPQFAKDVYASGIAPKITSELIEAYEYAEEQTGIPCEVVAGIHFTEGGSSPTQSVFDGGTLHGSLKDDAKGAMEHLISKWPGQFDKNNIEYEDLVEAIGNYNGTGNQNCGKETRWLNGGKCPSEFFNEDHPHPLAYIDERHSDMDLIFCLDFTEFNCSVSPTAATLATLRSQLDEKQVTSGFSDETKENLISDAANYCFANSSVCQTLSDGGKYPKYQRPGSVTTAILLNESGVGQ
ncbi:hypothetical protein KKI22_00315 [Patescibacteria group bacterium]|nr:hypothetical protein [Patescibacteria group bacterium]